jgi:hypothetical protein
MATQDQEPIDLMALLTCATRQGEVPKLPAVVHITGEHRVILRLLLVQHYRRRRSIRQLAKATNRSYTFIHNLLEEAGVEFRKRGGDSKGARPR